LAMFVAICLSAMCGLFLVRRLGMFDCLFGGAIVASLALFVFEWLLPRLGSVREIEIGYAIETRPLVWRHPFQAVRRITFAADPAEDYVERDDPGRLYEATIEVAEERPFRMIVDEIGAQHLKLWAAVRAIAVCDRIKDCTRTAEPAGEV